MILNAGKTAKAKQAQQSGRVVRIMIRALKHNNTLNMNMCSLSQKATEPTSMHLCPRTILQLVCAITNAKLCVCGVVCLG